VIVTDASVLADALIDDGAVGDQARAALLEDLHWAAPGHLVVEVVSVVRGRVAGGHLAVRRGGAALRALQELTIELVDSMDLVNRMWELRSNLTAYDAAYVAAAEQLGCRLVTADARLGGARGLRCPVQLVTGEPTEPRPL
jgi:predicted nucleic acid-binding protein